MPIKPTNEATVKVTLTRSQIIGGVMRKPEEGEIEVSPASAEILKKRGVLVTPEPAPVAAPSVAAIVPTPKANTES